MPVTLPLGAVDDTSCDISPTKPTERRVISEGSKPDQPADGLQSAVGARNGSTSRQEPSDDSVSSPPPSGDDTPSSDDALSAALPPERRKRASQPTLDHLPDAAR
jgi:hypothetical protein